ncbi:MULTISPECIES: site-specific integrase [Bacillus]|uniref:Site-specific integrase n=1 Tax=Bacillus thuringiensis serovar toumanoffi TaxID=180862 RepID=A0ABD5HVJ6_BACTU|nr:site-specific integrase [Bacillus thuringiensis]HDR4766312.1 site-specific integrase [Bacillus cereus]AND06608.1 integrase [Bacillus thuringiensis serovar alesti]EEM92479.1 Phage integrase [Bacillus thuringiensis IBL 200]MCR6778963.1 site-specific integrase [Bacillus thuringiensis]MCR6857031.1 site-specific integrase [Bacillus thuringiensis]
MASFRKRNDKWEYRIRYKEMGKYKETSKGGFKTKKEAQLAAAKIEEKLVNGSNIQDGKITFNEYLYEWLNVFKKGNVAPRTYMVYEKNIRLHILPVFGELKLKDLTRIKYQKFINNLLEKYSKKTVETINVTMHHALDTAVNELGILEKNPTTKIKLRTTRVSSKNDDIKCYDIDELHQFLTYILNEKGGFKYYSLFMFLSRTGLRIGECLALQWEDIDFEEQKLFINKTLITTKRNEKILFGPPKNRSSKRTISLDSSTISHLRKMKIEQNKNTLKNGKYYKEYNFVFTHEDNSCMLHPATLKFLQQACKKGNLKYITLHGFRHTHAVHLLQSGANLKYVSERLGHSSIDMTANVYLHITKSIEETAVNQYDEFLKSRGQIVGK